MYCNEITGSKMNLLAVNNRTLIIMLRNIVKLSSNLDNLELSPLDSPKHIPSHLLTTKNWAIFSIILLIRSTYMSSKAIFMFFMLRSLSLNLQNKFNNTLPKKKRLNSTIQPNTNSTLNKLCHYAFSVNITIPNFFKYLANKIC